MIREAIAKNDSGKAGLIIQYDTELGNLSMNCHCGDPSCTYGLQFSKGEWERVLGIINLLKMEDENKTN